MILSLSTLDSNTAVLPIATSDDIFEAVELVERIAATASDDLLPTPPRVLHQLDRIVVAAMSTFIAIDRDHCWLSMAETACMKRLLQRIGGLS
ncbi:MAG: hypothetical protein Q8K78_09080 [Planctomycetaceae bacterium]|nr:hypothetical protein [Planctomycetaceae bacterium]